jgi:hypothetical protein
LRYPALSPAVPCAFEIIAPERQIAEGTQRIRLAENRANSGRDIPRCLQQFLCAFEIIAPERQIAEGMQRIRFAKAIANPGEISRAFCSCSFAPTKLKVEAGPENAPHCRLVITTSPGCARPGANSLQPAGKPPLGRGVGSST